MSSNISGWSPECLVWLGAAGWWAGTDWSPNLDTGDLTSKTRHERDPRWTQSVFHQRVLIGESFHIIQQFSNVCSPSLTTNEGFLPAWLWKVFAPHPHMRGKSPPGLGIGLTYVDVEAYHGWFRHTRGFFAFPVMQMKSSGLTLHSNDTDARRMAWLCCSSEL